MSNVNIYTSYLQCKQYSFGSISHILDISASLFMVIEEQGIAF